MTSPPPPSVPKRLQSKQVFCLRTEPLFWTSVCRAKFSENSMLLLTNIVLCKT